MTLADIADVPQAAWVVIAALLGLIFGSFVTALSYRLPRGEDFVNARSKCPACGTSLAARDLIPVVSWIFNRARCRVCASVVSVRYPLTEILMAVLFTSAVWHDTRLAELGLLLFSAVIMVTLAIIDLETRRLPLSLLAILALACALLRWFGSGDLAHGLIIGALIAGLGLVTATATRIWLGAPIIGAGDAYALGIAGLALPWAVFDVFLAMAGGLGLALGVGLRVVRGERMFPFAPVMFAALWFSLVFQEQLIGLVAEL